MRGAAVVIVVRRGGGVVMNGAFVAVPVIVTASNSYLVAVG